MQIRHLPLEIPEEDPFANDCLDRKEYAEGLTALLKNIEGGGVLAINAPWGFGKSTFLQMWLTTLRSEGFYVGGFNAWETDFSNDPLLSLISEFESCLDQIKPKSGEKRKISKSIKNIKSAGAALLKYALPVGIRIATAGLINGTDILDEVAKESTSVTDKIAADLVAKYDAAKKSLHEFRKTLSEFAESMRASSDYPLVICIYELDRCRPSYAIEMLEIVKHLFEVDGIVFVLAIDRSQLAQSIKSQYGAEMDTDGYLRRFIDIEYRLPAPDTASFVRSLSERLGLNRAIEPSGQFNHDLCGSPLILPELLQQLFSVLGFSLRKQEQVLVQLSVILSCSKPNLYLYPYALGTLLSLKAFDEKMYRDFINGRDTPSQVIELIHSRDVEKIISLTFYIGIETWLRVFSNDEDGSAFADLQNMEGKNTDEQHRAARILAIYRSIDWSRRIRLDIIKKLEFAERFIEEE